MVFGNVFRTAGELSAGRFAALVESNRKTGDSVKCLTYAVTAQHENDNRLGKPHYDSARF